LKLSAGALNQNRKENDDTNDDHAGKQERGGHGLGARTPCLFFVRHFGYSASADRYGATSVMTALSCLGIGIAFAIAVGLLVLAGVLLSWVLPALIDRWRAARNVPPGEGH
jgi:hypothetical protein